MAFRPLTEDGLFKLPDDELVGYVVRARSERHASWEAGLMVLIYKHEHRVRRKVAAKVPAHLVGEITERALVEAYGSLFSKSTAGQFFSWLDTITARVIADHYRSPGGKMQRAETEMPENEDGADEISIDEITAGDSFSRALGMLDNEMHREVIELYLIEDRPAKAVAEHVGTTENNVHQIARRFREILRGLLDEEDWA